MTNIIRNISIITVLLHGTCLLIAGGNKFEREKVSDPFQRNSVARIGDYPYPTNPMNDRAIGYLLQGKINNGISNYGNIINWDEQPSGLWGDYSYLPSVAFLAGLPGHKKTSEYQWQSVETIVDNEGFVVYSIWESQSAYESCYENGDTNFVGILFNAEEDFGRWDPDSISKKISLDNITDAYQWVEDADNSKIIISTLGEANPNNSSSKIGLIYPWALRPKLKSREDQFDLYD